MTESTPDSAFYVAADSSHFVGVVALVNSLRLAGHDEPIYVGDCGFVESHRRRLEEHVTLVPTNDVRPPHLAKLIAPLAHPADVMVLIDADIVVTRSLAPLIDRASQGTILVFQDRVAHRFDEHRERWSTLLGLDPLPSRSYANTGILVADRVLGLRLFEQVAATHDVVDVERTVLANGRPEYPFYYLDQDLVNAFLATHPAEQVELLEHRLAPFPPFAGLRVLDEATLRCAYADGVQPYALHHIARKPWLHPTRWNPYSQLLGRLLLSHDVALPLRREELPLRLRTGAVAWLEKRRSHGLAVLHGMRGRLGLRRKLAARLGRRN